ncbi:hypothetical protein BOX15_Mlig030243g1 [Macrostomum lignano]|uniref:HCO3_cotransp domain-containing protein n=3 Tax=Macrostomum lignano TaxID=282301 RepID=A0A267H8X4_9PLAT|nr:hypothetical protein BOX15_Mlig030243g1 [Macrostomum lignano]
MSANQSSSGRTTSFGFEKAQHQQQQQLQFRQQQNSRSMKLQSQHQQPLPEGPEDGDFDEEAEAQQAAAENNGSRQQFGELQQQPHPAQLAPPDRQLGSVKRHAQQHQQYQQQHQQQQHLLLQQRRKSRGSGGSMDRIGGGAAGGDNLSLISGGSLAMYYRSPDGVDETLPCLVVSRLEKIPLKDFSSEIRANLDIERFLKEATLLLDLEGDNIESIIDRMLQSIFKADIEAHGSNHHHHHHHNQHHQHPVSAAAQADQAATSTGAAAADGGDPNDAALEAKVQDAKKTLFLQASWMDYSYQRLAKTIKSISVIDSEGLITDNSWLCTMCSLSGVNKRHVAIARLSSPVNLGRSSEGVHFILLVVTPTKEKGTKSDIEIGRTFATILADADFRQRLMLAESEDEFKSMMQSHAQDLGEEQRIYRRKSLRTKDFMTQAFSYENSWLLCNGIKADIKRRLRHYPSDFVDGFRGPKTLTKVLSTVIFLYFACLLPCIAFGVLNHKQTDGKISVERVVLSQGIGGVVFALIGGQPLIVMLTTAPLALYTRIIYEVSEAHGLDFFALFGWVGVFNALLLLLYATVDMAKLMRWSTRSTEEIFALFISIAFMVEAYKSVYYVFRENYSCAKPIANATDAASIANLSDATLIAPLIDSSNASTPDLAAPSCRRDISILFLMLCAGTVFLAMYLLNFTKTPYLNRAKRELMADFSLPVAVLVMSFCGSYLFSDVGLQKFECKSIIRLQFTIATPLPAAAILGAFVLALPLSMLFFMDQNISSAMVNCPTNKLKKGSAYHLDLLVVALINGCLSCVGLPWIHGALPHSPLHVKALADLEERIDLGQHVQQTVVRVRETRITGILANCLVGLSLLMCPSPLSYIPVPVLNGLFVCMAITSVMGNQLFERILLLFTEQAAYPPSHFLRRVPQRKVHIFTLLQLLQLAALCAVGFSGIAYAKMVFPVLLGLQMPIRHLLIPKLIDENYLDALDKPM